MGILDICLSDVFFLSERERGREYKCGFGKVLLLKRMGMNDKMCLWVLSKWYVK